MKRDRTCELVVPGDVKSLALIRSVVTTFAIESGLPREEVDKVEVAVDEACTNVIEHGYGRLERRPPLHLQINSIEKEFIVDIVDQGPYFDFNNRVQHKFPDHWMKGSETRGAGLYLIMKCMDRVDYERLPDERNRMRLVKQLN